MPGQSLRDAAFDLSLDAGWIDGETDILCDDVALDGDLARLGIDRHLCGVGMEARRVPGRQWVVVHARRVVRRHGAMNVPCAIRPPPEAGSPGHFGDRDPVRARNDMAVLQCHMLCRDAESFRREREHPPAQIAAPPRAALPTENAVRLPCAP